MTKNLFKNLCVAVCMLLISATAFAQPKHEVRAVWLTTNSAMDWPKSSKEPYQKKQLNQILDKLESAHFNTIILQVQVKGDVLWDSKIQPAMADFTKDGSKKMSWDACNYVIEECHKRNMECHAWIVPYRIGSASEAARYDNNEVVKHVYKLHPELCVEHAGDQYLDPGLPEVRKYLLDLYRELITNYAFDGTSFDYTRYPANNFNDAASYAKYGKGMKKDDWRRQNINTFVHEFYDMAKKIRPEMKVGAAPIGTYKNAPGYHNMEAYSAVFQDAAEWMQAGKHDLLVPQLYWNEKYGFSKQMQVWVDNCKKRQLVAGLATYKMFDTSNRWDQSVILDQIEKTRKNPGFSGVSFFHTVNITGIEKKSKDLLAALKDNYFKYPAHIPSMDYNGVTKQHAPENVMWGKHGNEYTLTWDAAITTFEKSPVKYYCVYASTTPNVDVTDIKNCVGFAVKGTEFKYTSAEKLNFAVTAFDTNYYESDAAKAQETAGIDGVEVLDETEIISSGSEILVKGDELQSVQVYDIAGKMVRSINADSCEVSVAADDLVNGVYIVKVINSDNQISVHKIMR